MRLISIEFGRDIEWCFLSFLFDRNSGSRLITMWHRIRRDPIGRCWNRSKRGRGSFAYVMSLGGFRRALGVGGWRSVGGWVGLGNLLPRFASMIGF